MSSISFFLAANSSSVRIPCSCSFAGGHGAARSCQAPRCEPGAVSMPVARRTAPARGHLLVAGHHARREVRRDVRRATLRLGPNIGSFPFVFWPDSSLFTALTARGASASSAAIRPTATRSSGWMNESAIGMPFARRDGVPQRDRPPMLEQDDCRRGVVRDLLDHVRARPPREEVDAFLGAFRAELGSGLRPSSPATPRPISAPTVAPNSAASSSLRSVRLITVTSPSASL